MSDIQVVSLLTLRTVKNFLVLFGSNNILSGPGFDRKPKAYEDHLLISLVLFHSSCFVIDAENSLEFFSVISVIQVVSLLTLRTVLNFLVSFHSSCFVIDAKNSLERFSFISVIQVVSLLTLRTV